MLQHGYTRLLSKPNIYICHTSQEFLVVALYVDDIPLLGSSDATVQLAKKELSTAFAITSWVFKSHVTDLKAHSPYIKQNLKMRYFISLG